MTRVRAFLLPASWLPKSQKGLGNTRVPHRHVTEGQANVPKRERSYLRALVQVLYVLHGAAGTEMDRGSAKGDLSAWWLVHLDVVIC